MISIEKIWPKQTPERVVADAFLAFRRRDVPRLVARLPKRFTDSVRCVIVGHVTESRSEVARRDAGGLIRFECRVTGTEGEWLSVYGDPQIGREVTSHAAGVAHVVFRVAYELPGQDIVAFPPELQIASTQLVGNEWKLVLDEWSDVGLPGFRGIVYWTGEG